MLPDYPGLAVATHSCREFLSPSFYAFTMIFIYRKVKAVQSSYILSTLKRHAKSRYGEDFDFSNIKSVEEFRSRHPLTKYSHYKKYIDAIYNGDKAVMSSTEPYVLAMTSGTSGE